MFEGEIDRIFGQVPDAQGNMPGERDLVALSRSFIKGTRVEAERAFLRVMNNGTWRSTKAGRWTYGSGSSGPAEEKWHMNAGRATAGRCSRMQPGVK